MAEPRPGDDVEIWTGAPSRATRVSYRLVRGLFLVLFRLFGRVRVVGTEKVPAHGAFVLAPVHRSNVDFALQFQLLTQPQPPHTPKPGPCPAKFHSSGMADC